MPHKWKPAKNGRRNFPGVQFYEDPSRPKYPENTNNYDRYFRGRFSITDKNTKKKTYYYVCFGWSSSGKWTEEKCFQKLQKYKENAKNGTGPTSWQEELKQKQSQNITVKEFFEEYYYPNAQFEKPKSAHKEEQHFRNWIKPILGNKAIKNVTYNDLELLRNRITQPKEGKPRSNRPAQYVLATFRAIWKYAKKHNYVSGDYPGSELKFSIDNNRVNYLEAHEVQALLERLHEENLDAHDFAVAALNTGARRSELLNLKWDDVSFQTDKITFWHTKTKKPRQIPMTKELRKVMTRRKENALSSYVFSHTEKPPRDVPNTLRRVIDEMFNKDIDASTQEGRKQRRTLHSLRHTAASHMYQSGLDAKTICEFFGWSTIQMLERYTHIADDAKQRAAKSLEHSYTKKPEEDESKVIPINQAS